MKFQESALAHRLLDGKRGIEIGPSAHNPFGLNTVNVGRSTKGTVYEHAEIDLCGEAARIEVEAEADSLPFEDGKWDFVIASHVLEHLYDLIGTLKEWMRVVSPGGLVFVIFPHKERMFDKDRPRTTLAELMERHRSVTSQESPTVPSTDQHHTVWITEDALELCRDQNWKVLEFQDTDDKVGNGFTFVIQK